MFTTEACAWVVSEFAVALGLIPDARTATVVVIPAAGLSAGDSAWLFASAGIEVRNLRPPGAAEMIPAGVVWPLFSRFPQHSASGMRHARHWWIRR